MTEADTAVKASKTATPCACGCGTQTMATFAPGHDNRFYGQVVRGERKPEDLMPFAGLMRKYNNRNKAVKAEAKAAEVAEATGGVTKVKMGRWTYDVKAARELDDGQFEIGWTDGKGNARTSVVTADKLVK